MLLKKRLSIQAWHNFPEKARAIAIKPRAFIFNEVSLNRKFSL